MDEWCLIESDPAVFWDITRQLGVCDVQYEEVLDLTPEGFQDLDEAWGRIIGLIFLFRWHADLNSLVLGEKLAYVPTNMFFARQVIQNSCATQALLSILMNKDDEIKLGDTLLGFKEFTSQFDPELCGISLANHEPFRQIHNSFKVIQNLQIIEDKEDKQTKEDPFHYVAIFPKMNKVWLLDGLNDGPICLGLIGDQPWWLTAQQCIMKYINKLQTLPSVGGTQGTEIRFNLIAVVPDRLKALEAQAGALDKDTYDGLVAVEVKRREGWVEENVLRKHDLLPFLLCCLRHLAKERKLSTKYKEIAETQKQQ